MNFLSLIKVPSFLLALVAAVLSLSGVPKVSFAQGLVAVSGTTVSMTAPKGFTPSERFSGFENEAIQSSFVINELPIEAKDQLLPIFGDFDLAKQAFATSGVGLTFEETVRWNEADHSVLVGMQNVGGVNFEKWISIFVGEKVVLMTFQGPPGVMTAEALRAAFASVQLGAPPTLDEQLALLPYKFGELGAVRLVRVLPQSSSLLTIGEKDEDPTGEQPFLLVAPSISPFEIPSDRKANGLALLEQLRQMKDIEVLEGEDFDFAGAQGYRLVVAATDTLNQKPMRVVQWVRYDGDGYLRVLGFIPKAMADDVMPQFQAVVDDLAIGE